MKESNAAAMQKSRDKQRKKGLVQLGGWVTKTERKKVCKYLKELRALK